MSDKISDESCNGHRKRKIKRSYSIDPQVCEELDLLAWYRNTSASAIVEDLIRLHLERSSGEVNEAQGIRARRLKP